MTSKLTYLIAVYPDEDGFFMARFPDFPDMAPDYGKGFEDCIEQSTRFLDEMVAMMVKHEQNLPTPSSVMEIHAKLDPAYGEPLCIVPVTVYPPAKTMRINITGKSDIFARIDDYAKKLHLSRSELMIRSTLAQIREKA